MPLVDFLAVGQRERRQRRPKDQVSRERGRQRSNVSTPPGGIGSGHRKCMRKDRVYFLGGDRYDRKGDEQRWTAF